MLHDVKHIRKAKEAVKRLGFSSKRFSLVELLSMSDKLGLNPVEALNRIRDEMIPNYPLEYLDRKFGGENGS